MSPRIEPGGVAAPRTSIEPDVLRAALGSLSRPAAVVTSYLDGRPHGTPVGAFTRLSVTPPLVLVALDIRCRLLDVLRDAGGFAVNVLASDQHELARTLAGQPKARFDRIPWQLERGVPRIQGAATFIACRLEDLLPGGDHLIAIGHVTHAESSEAEPLLRRERSFGTLASLPG